ncbi:MAG TPA: RCC1 domain-containing protein, partial [Polyangiaceae bacterium LLY-WYZ-14_1]|nr:RCC1 domain-containing protein [Polyangiaceae bacterium LLY-WYZ-14_1]
MPSFDTSDQPLHPAGRPGASLRPRPGALSLALLAAGAVAAVGCAQDQQVLRFQDRFPPPDAGRDTGLPDGGGAAGINLPGATVALGPNHTCAVASDGRLLCWGDDGA